MASNREERFLMRQRGAGTRQLRDSGFALDIPNPASTPLQPQSSARSRRSSQTHQRTTPKSTPRTYSIKKPTPQSVRARNQQLGVTSNSPTARATHVDSQGSVRKKRRLATPVDDIAEEEAADELEEIAEEVEEDEVPPEDTPEVAEESNNVPEPLEPPESTGPSTTPAKKRKKRKSIGQQSLRKKRKSNLRLSLQDETHIEDDVAETAADATGAVEQTPEAAANTPAVQSTKRNRKSSTQKGPLEPADDNIERAGPERASDEGTAESPPTAKKRGRPFGKRVTALVEAEAPPQALENTATPDSARRRGRPRKSDILAGTNESPDITRSTGKPRGRPRKSDLADTPSKVAEQVKVGHEETSPQSRRVTTKLGAGVRERTTGDGIEATVEASKMRGRPRKPDVSETVVKGPTRRSHAQEVVEPSRKAIGKRKATAPERAQDEESDEEEVSRQPPSASKPRGRPKKNEATSQVRRRDSSVPALSTKSRGRPRKSDATITSRAAAEGTPAKARGRPRKSDVSEPATTLRPRPRAKSVPARRRSASPDGEPQTDRRAKAGSIPVLVHRLSRPQALNFLEDDEDDLAGPAPLLKKAGVNAVDVLSQICREILAKSIEAVKLNAEREHGSKKAEWNRKRKAVEMFNDSLQARLLQMTTALDHNSGLAMKLKQVNKAKANHREELIQLRQEREELAIQMDAIRIKHDRSTESAKGTNDLNTALHDIELAVQRGRAAQANANEEDLVGENGLGSRIQQVVENLSSADGRQGLLEKVKSYNAYLEAAVGLL